MSLDNSYRYKLGQQAALVSIVGNFFLFLVKFYAGKISNSLSLMSDAWHTMSDSFSSLVLILGLFLANRPPTKKHPFGFGRWENIVGIFIAFILAIVAYDFLRSSYERFLHKEYAQFGMLAIWVTILSIVLKELMARYTFYIAKKTDNEAVRADGWHHRSDALSSMVVLAGIFFQKYVWWIDNLLGAIIGLFLFYIAYDIIKKSIEKLLGEEISEDSLRKIKANIHKIYPEEIYPHHFHLHTYGSHKELTFHIRLPADITLKEAHEIANRIEKELKRICGVEVTIHVDPMD